MKSQYRLVLAAVAALGLLLEWSTTAQAAGTAYDEPISYTVNGSYVPISGASSSSATVNISTNYGSYSQTAVAPAKTSSLVSDYAEYASMVDVTVNNASSFTLTIAIKPIFDAYINGVIRNSYTISNLDSSGNPISGSVTYHIPICMVRKWLGESVYLAPVESVASKISLGESSSVVLPQSVSATESTVVPTLTFGMGLAKNGMPLPPLRVYADVLPNWAYPDVPDMVQTTKSSTTTWVQVPQVTAIITKQAQYGSLNAGPTLTVSFALPGQEATPFLTYSFNTVSASSTADGGYTEQLYVQKSYSDNTTQYRTDLNNTIVKYPPPGTNFPSYYGNTISYKDWHATTSTTAPRNVSLTTQASNSSFVSAVYQVDDGNNNVATSTRYDYTLVTTNVNGQGTFSIRWVRSKVTEAYNAQNYVSQTLYSGSDYYEAGRTDTLGGTTWWTFSNTTGDTAGMYPGTQYAPWNNTVPAFNGSTTGSRVTQFGYGSDWGGTPVVTSKTDSVNGVTIGSQQIQYAFTGDAAGDNETLSNGLNIVVTTKNTTTLGNATQQQITKTYRPDNADTLFEGTPYSVTNPDGSMTSFAYERGTYSGGSSFTVQANGPDLQITKFSGVAPGGAGVTTVSATPAGTAIDPVGMVANRSMITVDIWQRDGGSSTALPDGARFLVHHENDLYNGTGYTLLTSEQYVFSNGRLKSRTAGNGVSVSTQWNGDEKGSEVDELGRTHTFGYDTGGRLQTESVTGVTTAPYGSGTMPTLLTTYGYDADNRVTSRAVGPTGGEKLVTTTKYDTGGRVSQSTDARGVITNYQRSNGDQTVQETYGDSGTKITTRQADGRIASITGTAVLNEFYNYSIDGQGRPYTTTNLGSSNGRSKTSYFDLIGREVEIDTNSFGANGATKPIVVTNSYNGNGWLENTHTVMNNGGQLSADRLTFYDVLGAVTDEGLDLNNDGHLTVSSTDRYVHHTVLIGANPLYAGQWLKTTNVVYTTNNAGDNFQTEVDSQIGGFSANVQATTVSYDRYQNATTTTVTVDPANHWTVQSTKAPDGSSVAKYTVGGVALAEASFDSSGTALAWTSYSYDAQGRLVGTQDSRKGTATNVYYAGSSQLNFTKDAAQNTIATYSTYDGAGRPTKVLDALGNDTQFVYNLRGQITQQSGAGAVPVQYDYNSYGEKIAMRTYRNGLTGTADWTNWVYDSNTGWLTAKIDAVPARDSSGNVASASGHEVTYDYTYDFPNQVRYVARTASRGTVRTEKHSLVTDELLAVTYVDQSGVTTPPLSYSYTRDGQISTVSDATGGRSFIYSSGDISAEAFDSTFYRGAQNGLVAAVNRENATSIANHTIFGRYSGYSLGYVLSAGSTADLNDELAAAITYDGASRVHSVTASYKAQGSRPASATAFTYNYNTSYAPAGQWYQVQQGSYTLSRAFENHRDIVNSVKATSATGTITDFELQKDSAGRAQYVVQSGYAYADYGSAIHVRYAYDSVGNLQGATAYFGSDGTSTANPMRGMGLAYTYDTFGNRATASVDGVSINYTDGLGNTGANSLNEIGQRGTLPTHVSGTVFSGSSVTANGVSATVVGNYWDAALPVSSGGSYNSQLPVVASNGGQSASTTIPVLMRPASETYSYDSDGNLLLDSLWSYTWDAEDRLIRIATSSAAVAFGAPNYSIAFKYDFLGRRVQKTTMLNGAKTFDSKYVYQGSLLVAELDVDTNQVVQSYTWGPDVGGTIGGAGGIGGLLLVASETTSAITGYDVGFDGNGNVTSLLATADGALAATYEYDPYGQMVRRQGPMAQKNPFEFSTKYTDVETGLVYFGRRYYDSTAGRFVNRDPSGEAGGLNLFRFANGDPIDQFDAFGLNPMDEQEIVTAKEFEQSGGTGTNWSSDPEVLADPELSVSDGRYSPASQWEGRTITTAEAKDNERDRAREEIGKLRERMQKASDEWKKSHNLLQRIFEDNKFERAVAVLDGVGKQLDNESNNAPNSAASGSGRVMVIPSDIRGSIYKIYGTKSTDSGHRVMRQVVPVVYVGPAVNPANIAKFETSVRKYWTGKKYGDDAMAHEIASIDFVSATTDRAGTPKGLVVYIAADGMARSVYDGGRNIIGFNVDDPRDFVGAHEFGHYMGLKDQYEEVQDPEAPGGVRTRWTEPGAENHLMGGGTGLDWADFLPAWRAMEPR